MSSANLWHVLTHWHTSHIVFLAAVWRRRAELSSSSASFRRLSCSSISFPCCWIRSRRAWSSTSYWLAKANAGKIAHTAFMVLAFGGWKQATKWAKRSALSRKCEAGISKVQQLQISWVFSDKLSTNSTHAQLSKNYFLPPQLYLPSP